VVMLAAGANVARSARIEDAYAQAQAGVKTITNVTASAQWHEQQTIRSLSKSLARERDRTA
jgi:hypothetical protein